MMKALNRKLILIAIISVLLVSFALTGCQSGDTEGSTPANTTAPTEGFSNPTQEPTETTAPQEALEVYWNIDRLTYMPEDNTDGVSTRKPEADGTYSVNFVYKGKLVTKKVKADAELINKIDSQFVIGGLIVDSSNVITGIQTVEEVGGKIVADEQYVTKYDGTNLKVNEAADHTGASKDLKLENNTYVLNVTSENPTNLFGLLKGDKVIVISNKNDKVTHVFMYAPSEIRVGRVAYCEHCQKEVKWSCWSSSDAFPVSNSGHFYLFEDVALTRQQSMSADVQLILDLNGKTIKRTTGKEEDSTGRVISLHNPGCYLALLDTSEGKTGKIASSGDVGAYGGVIWVRDGQFDMYGGTLDGSGSTNSGRGAVVHVASGKVFNMYGGTIIGSTTQSILDSNTNDYSSGGWGGSVYVDGEFSMYGGVIKDGKALCTEFDGFKSGGSGGNVAIGDNGVFNMLGGEIYNGTADNGEADLYVMEGGVFNQTGGKIGTE